MTKRDRIKLAKSARAHGYFRRSDSRAAVRCPLCHEEVETEHLPWKKPFKALDDAVSSHLEYDCEAS